MPEAQLSLAGYITHCGKRRGIGREVLDGFEASHRRYTNLRGVPSNPISDVMKMKPGLDREGHYLMQAFLCSVLARNYFAHHYYLDDTLRRSEESGFLLAGMIVTVLTIA
jgi:hypothetical protein